MRIVVVVADLKIRAMLVKEVTFNPKAMYCVLQLLAQGWMRQVLLQRS